MELTKTACYPTRIFKNELKQFQKGFGFIANKEIIRCDGRSQYHWVENDSIVISFKSNSIYFDILHVLFYLCLIVMFLSNPFALWNPLDDIPIILFGCFSVLFCISYYAFLTLSQHNNPWL